MFIESPRFPVLVSQGAAGGPEFNTDVVMIRSGFEARNINWETSRARYDAALGVKQIQYLEEVIAFFRVAQGKAHEFRYKDFSDYKSCSVLATPAFTDQTIGVGDGVTATFQLRKTYTVGSNNYVRTIKKPVSGTVLVGVNGVQRTITTHWTINTATGVITFTAGNIPAAGHAVTAGFEFDVPCRFDTDHLNISLPLYLAGAVSIPLVEVRV